MKESSVKLGFRTPMLHHWATSRIPCIFVSRSSSWQDEKIFLYLFNGLKTYHLCYSIYKHDAIDIADPSKMQDKCHTWAS